MKSSEWQSFEVRMRRRRAARCRLRAELAIEAGHVADARTALEEARALDPDAAQLREIEHKLSTAEAAPTTAPAVEAGTHRFPWRPIAAVFAAAAAGLLAWMAVASRTPRVAGNADAPIAAVKNVPAAERVVRIEQLTVPAHVLAEEASQPAALSAAGLAALGTTGTVPTSPEQSEGNVPAPAASSTVAALTEPPPAPSGPVRAEPVAQPAAIPLGNDPVAVPTLPVANASLPSVDPPPAPEPARETAAREPVVPAVAREDTRVRAVLSRFEAAYTALDPLAAQSVWPNVDGRALARAFDNLESQTISLDRCNIAISGASAHANCSGTYSWTPKVGGGPRTEPRRWTFDLANARGDWQIVQARVR